MGTGWNMNLAMDFLKKDTGCFGHVELELENIPLVLHVKAAVSYQMQKPMCWMCPSLLISLSVNDCYNLGYGHQSHSGLPVALFPARWSLSKGH